MLSVDEALRQILSAFSFIGEEEIDLSQSLGRVLAQDITARLTNPPFAMSAMDGYAVRTQDVRELPVHLRLIGESAAGDSGDITIGVGECVRIFTGAPLPDGADCVVIQENCERHDQDILIREGSTAPGQFIRPAGLDFNENAIGCRKGKRINARDIGLIAAMNWAKIKVARRPIIAILSTGNELIEPGTQPKAGQIINSNAAALAAFITALGGEPHLLGTAKDDPAELRNLLRQGQGHDLLITIGGASVGEHDLVKGLLAELGMKMNFWKIAMRPGKPLLFGQWDTMPVLGLPGNPVSVMVTAMVFLRPAISLMLGETRTGDHRTAVLGMDLPANDSRQDYLRAQRIDHGTPPTICPFPKQDSSMISPLAQADCLAIRPPFAPPAKKGEDIEIIVFPDRI